MTVLRRDLIGYVFQALGSASPSPSRCAPPGIITLDIRAGQLGLIAALAIGAGIVAAVNPARRAARVDIIQAVITG